MSEKASAPSKQTPVGTVPEPTAKKGKTPGKWFQKIPREIIFSPGGAVLIFLALIIEVIDWIPVPGIDNVWELPLELIFIVFLAVIAKLPFQAMIIPFIIERIPGVNDVVPTWLLRLFI